MKFSPIMFMTSYLFKSPARLNDPYISDNCHLKHDNNFWTKSINRKNLPSRRFSHGTAHIYYIYSMGLTYFVTTFAKEVFIINSMRSIPQREIERTSCTLFFKCTFKYPYTAPQNIRTLKCSPMYYKPTIFVIGELFLICLVLGFMSLTYNCRMDPFSCQLIIIEDIFSV